jgi:hypothetical protein
MALVCAAAVHEPGILFMYRVIQVMPQPGVDLQRVIPAFMKAEAILQHHCSANSIFRNLELH